MAYATADDFQVRFGEAELLSLADRDGDDEVDTAVIDSALADASTEIDSYVSRRYSVPVAGSSDQLKKIACDIARWHLYTDAPHEKVEAAYKRAVDWLKDVGAGRANLDVAGEEPEAGSAGSAEIESAERVFSHDSLKGF